MIESSLRAEYQAKHYIKDWQTFYKKPEGIKKKKKPELIFQLHGPCLCPEY